MIPEYSIKEWNEHVPWKEVEQVEQDLMICRALVAIFSDEFLASNLAFRGGTALHKLYLSPQPRYSEDIDLVQINPGPIKDIMFRLGEVLDFIPGRVTKQKRHSNSLLFRVDSEIPPQRQLRLKVEINCFEHFNVLGLVKIPFSVENPWFTGSADITTYKYEELLGTKLRALYQRKRGRDLFDLYIALTRRTADIHDVLKCYDKYISFVVGQTPTFKQYVANMDAKMEDPEFMQDMTGIIRPGTVYDPKEAYRMVYEYLLELLPGKRE